MTKQDILAQFDRLIADAEQLCRSPIGEDAIRQNLVASRGFSVLRTQALNLVARACGKDSEHYAELQRISETHSSPLASNVPYYLGVLEGGRRDFEADALTDLRRLVAADLFSDFLEQAEELLSKGFHIAAASLAGAVLEDTLRKLSDRKAITYPAKTKIDPLNIALAKAGVYGLHEQKQITAYADIRNEADHGHFQNVKRQAVEDMVRWVRRFITDHLR